MDINTLNRAEKIRLFKELLDDLDVIVTGCYGAYDFAVSENVREATPQDAEYLVGCNSGSLILMTDINTE